MQNLIFKVNHGLSKQASEVSQSISHIIQQEICSRWKSQYTCAAQDEAFLQNLLSWFQHDNGDTCDCAMLDMLRKLAQQQGVSAKLCSLGLIATLDAMQHKRSPEVQRSVNRMLTALMQSDPSPTRQPCSPAYASQNTPRSRCQSNSPLGLQAEQPKRHPHWVTESHTQPTCHVHDRSCSGSQLASQAFGSQQGRASCTHQEC